MDVVNLGRRKAVELKRRILRVQRPQQIFIPLDAKVRMQAALHQHTGAAKRDRLVDLLANFLERADVSVRRARATIESAEGTDNVADVGVVDVAVDDVGDDVCRMPALANFVGGRADAGDVMRLKQRGAIVGGQPRPPARARSKILCI